MNIQNKNLKDSISLLDALEGMGCKPALLSLLVGFVASAVMLFLSLYIAGRLAYSGNSGTAAVFTFIGTVGSMLVGLSGFSAAGIHLSRRFRGVDELPFMTAFLAALATLPRFLAIFFLIGLIGLLVVLSITLVFWICKIPGVGPLLYLVALPVSAILVGVLGYALTFITPLSAPAIWSGKKVFGTIAVLFAITKTRLLNVIVNALLLNILVGLVAAIILGGVMSGLFVTGALSVAVIGDLASNPMAMLTSWGNSSGSGHVVAGGVGVMVLLACAMAFPALVLISGNCVVYNRVTEGLETGEVEEKLRATVQNVREQAEQAGKRLGEASEGLVEKAKKAGNAVGTSATEAASACTKCSLPVGPQDAFCGNCGNRLK